MTAPVLDTPTAADARSAPFHRRRWARRLLLAGLLMAALYLLRAPLLQAAAGLLVSADPLEPREALLLQGGDQTYARAAQLYHDGWVKHLLLIESFPNRLQRLGIVPTNEEKALRALLAEGVPREAVTVLEGIARNDWERAWRLRAWLIEHPSIRLTIQCGRFNSRRLRWVFTRVLGADLAQRVAYHPVPERRFDETNWWQRKEGLLVVFNEAVGLTHVGVYGEPEAAWHPWDPDQYEQSLR